MARKHKQIPSGTRFTRLVVLNLVTMTPRPAYQCQCDCGNIVIARSADLRSGNTKSCECLKLEKLAINRTKIDNVTHGEARRNARTRTYAAWAGMHQRCKPDYIHHQNYYDRGIRVEDYWNSYEIFKADMHECPPGLTLERRNNDGNYGPGNCYWATRVQQANNQRGHNGTCRSKKIENFTSEEFDREAVRRGYSSLLISPG